jgi:hypothetical protein
MDMNQENALTLFLQAHEDAGVLLAAGQQNKQRFQAQFLWKGVKKDYLDMLVG